MSSASSRRSSNPRSPRRVRHRKAESLRVCYRFRAPWEHKMELPAECKSVFAHPLIGRTLREYLTCDSFFGFVVQLFEDADVDGTGTLSPLKVTAILAAFWEAHNRGPPPDEEQTRKLVQMLDSNGNGELEIGESVQLFQWLLARDILMDIATAKKTDDQSLDEMWNLIHPVQEEEVPMTPISTGAPATMEQARDQLRSKAFWERKRAEFLEADINGDGWLTFEESKEFLTRLHQKMHGSAGAVSERSILLDFYLADRDGDGRLEFDKEFFYFIRRQYLGSVRDRLVQEARLSCEFSGRRLFILYLQEGESEAQVRTDVIDSLDVDPERCLFLVLPSDILLREWATMQPIPDAD